MSSRLPELPPRLLEMLFGFVPLRSSLPYAATLTPPTSPPLSLRSVRPRKGFQRRRSRVSLSLTFLSPLSLERKLTSRRFPSHSVSGLEMSQNSARIQWTREEVDEKLVTIMHNCCTC